MTDKPKDNGGPAFPSDIGQMERGLEGISVRDYFAAAALSGHIAAVAATPEQATDEILAAWAYDTADAMLAERNKP